jgi:hypothetical protein
MPIPGGQRKGFGGTWFHNKELGTANPNRNRTATNPAESGVKVPGLDWNDRSRRGQAFNGHADRNLREAVKGADGGWFNDYKRDGRSSGTGRLSRSGSKSTARKAASAMIAKIPGPLSRHLARVFRQEWESRAFSVSTHRNTPLLRDSGDGVSATNRSGG